MVTLKGVVIGAGLLTGATGIAGAVAYSSGAFDSNIQISKLLEDENKYALLPTSGTENSQDWTNAWNKYKEENESKGAGKDKWGLSTAAKALGTMPDNFKNTCEKKSKELVKDKTDQKYIDITNYCSRPKTLKEVLTKEGTTNLLSDKDKDTIWTPRYERYKQSNNKLPKVTGASGEDFNKLKEGCKNATELKTTEDQYDQTYRAFKEWCLE